jgi:RHS repeat-associated protein
MDLNYDGIVNSADATRWGQYASKSALAAGLISDKDGPDNIIGYGGYVFAPETKSYLARHRWYDPTLGRFINRDPAGYVDGLNLYEYAVASPILLSDPMGLEPNQKGATVDPKKLIAEIKELEKKGLTSKEILETLSKKFEEPGKSNTDRYFYTDRYGWVDVRHFFFAANKANEWGIQATLVGGVAYEWRQWVEESVREYILRDDEVYQSAFSSEDVPSNRAGAYFSDCIPCEEDGKPIVALSFSFELWANRVGMRPHDDPATGYSQLPVEDPASRKKKLKHIDAAAGD